MNEWVGRQICGNRGAALNAGDVEGGERGHGRHALALQSATLSFSSRRQTWLSHRTHTQAVSINKTAQAAIFQLMAPADHFHTWAATAHFLFRYSKQPPALTSWDRWTLSLGERANQPRRPTLLLPRPLFPQGSTKTLFCNVR